MKIIDEKGRLFGLISVIDIAVILIVAALVGCFFLKNHKTENILNDDSSKNKITYTLLIKTTTKEEADALKVGDSVFSSEYTSENKIGTIEDISIADAVASSQLLDGTYVDAKVDNRYDVTVTVSAYANVSEDGNYLVDSVYEVDQNKTHSLYTKYSKFDCVIKEVYDEQ